MPIDRRDLALLELVGMAAARLNRDGTRAHASSLKLREDLTAEEWANIGSRLAALHAAVSWWLADWAAAGFAGQHERAPGAAGALVGLTPKTARKLARVSEGVAPDLRRYRLSFDHHAEVLGMDFAEAFKWLFLAELHNWTSDELRETIRASR